MNQQIQLFENQEIMVLTKLDVNFKFKGEFLINAKNVAQVLEYSRTEEVTKFCKGDQLFLVKNADISDSAKNRIRKLNNAGEFFVSNLSLNRILGKSEKPKAERFQDWLYEDVVPSIQNHGGYLTPAKVEEVLLNPDTIIQLATQLKQEREERERLAVVVEKQQPLVDFAQICIQSDKSIKVRELARSLSSHGITIGEKRLYQKLRSWKYIEQKSTEPTQKAVELGFFEVVTGAKEKPSGEPFTWRTTYVTTKGQAHIANRLKRGDQQHDYSNNDHSSNEHRR